MNAGLGLCLEASEGAAAVVAGLLCACCDFAGVRALCGEMEATAGVVLKGCDTDGRLFDIDLKALEPGLIAAFIAMLYCIILTISKSKEHEYNKWRGESSIRARGTKAFPSLAKSHWLAHESEIGLWTKIWGKNPLRTIYW